MASYLMDVMCVSREYLEMDGNGILVSLQSMFTAILYGKISTRKIMKESVGLFTHIHQVLFG